MNIVARNVWAGDIPASGVPSRIGLPAPRVWLHHGASGYSTVATARAYARYHIRTRGYLDVGYSFLVAEGKVLEGRGPGRQGAHTRSDNSESHGIVVCGNYTRTEPAQRDIDALRWLLSHGHRQGWWPYPAFTGGHRNAPGASTTCPGDRLQRRLGDLNRPVSPIEDDDMLLTRIEGSAAVYQPVGRYLFQLNSAEQAAAIAKVSGRTGKWQNHVGNLTKSEASAFEIVRDLPSSGGGLSQSEADSRYVRRGTTVKLP